MIDALRQLLRNAISIQPEHPITDEQQLRLSIAALLIQVSGADTIESGEEQQVIFQRLSKLLSISPDESRALYIEAQKIADNSTSLYEFTRSLKTLDYIQRYDFIQALWQVAYADGVLDPQEEALIRKIADLIYVDHKDFIQAKLNVQPSF